MINKYSQKWFDLFLPDNNNIISDQERLFLENLIKDNRRYKVLDVACGNIRYFETFKIPKIDFYGIDINQKALHVANSKFPNAELMKLDMRELSRLNLGFDFDIILLMWQSFGYFSDEVNTNILLQISKLLVKGGKFVLDIYNPDFYNKYQGTRKFEKDGVEIIETKFVEKKRLNVKLKYSNGGFDEFNWRLYDTSEIKERGSIVGLELSKIMTKFDSKLNITSDDPRIQYLFVKK